jgi:uncharacterized protein (TIGR02996 family)
MKEEFEEALRLAPHDRALRWVYADWLEEHGRLTEALEQRQIADDPYMDNRDKRLRGDKVEFDTTASSAVYRKINKLLFARCSRCPWHDGENISRRPARSSWKKSRKHRWRAR